jgi:dTDP-4-dehydrorhamnose 3,5-epimerase
VRVEELTVAGAVLVHAQPSPDERGYYARSFDRRDFEAAGLDPLVAQTGFSYNRQAGTVRGLHYQVPPGQEAKLVRCMAGAIVDVLVDLREGSPTYLQSYAVELRDPALALYIPPQCAHGFQTLVDDTYVSYQMSNDYQPEWERGLRHDDPALGLAWPLPVSAISDKDRRWPLLAPR